MCLGNGPVLITAMASRDDSCQRRRQIRMARQKQREGGKKEERREKKNPLQNKHPWLGKRLGAVCGCGEGQGVEKTEAGSDQGSRAELR